MFKCKNYVQPETVDEAYELCQKKQNVIIGGMIWLKMMHKNINTAIDISSLKLDYITEDDNCFHIGAMTCLRKLEVNISLKNEYGDVFEEALKHIVGVQFRNSATIGGSIYGRYGFSDVITVCMALDARVVLHHGGEMSLIDFMGYPKSNRDILLEVKLPKYIDGAVYMSQRNISTDFPTLTCAVSRFSGKYYCTLGARPLPANRWEVPDINDIEESANKITEAAVFGSNTRASAEYRKLVAKALIKRSLNKLTEGESQDGSYNYS